MRHILLLLEYHPRSSLAKRTSSVSYHIHLARVVVVELLLVRHLLLAEWRQLRLLDHIALRWRVTHMYRSHG